MASGPLREFGRRPRGRSDRSGHGCSTRWGFSDLKGTAGGRGPCDCSGQLKHDLEGKAAHDATKLASTHALGRGQICWCVRLVGGAWGSSDANGAGRAIGPVGAVAVRVSTLANGGRPVSIRLATGDCKPPGCLAYRPHENGRGQARIGQRDRVTDPGVPGGVRGERAGDDIYGGDYAVEDRVTSNDRLELGYLGSGQWWPARVPPPGRQCLRRSPTCLGRYRWTTEPLRPGRRAPG